MKYSNIKSKNLGIMLFFCARMFCGDFQATYEQLRLDTINDLAQFIDDTDKFRQDYPTIEEAELMWATLMTDTFIVNAPQVTQETRNEMIKVFLIMESLKGTLRHAYKLRRFWQNLVYDPLNEEQLAVIMQQYADIMGEMEKAQDQFMQDIQSLPDEQIIGRTLQYLEERKALKEQLYEL